MRTARRKSKFAVQEDADPLSVVVNLFDVAMVFAVALMVAMVISGAVGTLIPLFFKKINVDPAVASGPLITTINDLVAVITYYGLCGILLIGVLHLAG